MNEFSIPEKKKDGRSISSALNGKRYGGRKKGLASIEAERSRAYIAERIGEYMPAIFQALVEKAVTGDVAAVRELFDRAFGKSKESVTVSFNDVDNDTFDRMNDVLNNYIVTIKKKDDK